LTGRVADAAQGHTRQQSVTDTDKYLIKFFMFSKMIIYLKTENSDTDKYYYTNSDIWSMNQYTTHNERIL
jgi:hypothetical protein